MKLMKKILSTTIAMTISMGNAALFPMTSYAEAVNWDKVLENGPSWLAYDFGSSMYFRNHYGTTKAEGDMLCIVYRVPDYYKMNVDISSFKRDDGAIASAEYEWKTFVFDTVYRTTSGRSFDANDSEVRGASAEGFHYEELMILNNCAKGFDIDISLENTQTGDASDSVRYTFVNEDGELKETDIYGWLPDCVPEFEDYVRENGNVSIKDGLLIYCNTINYSTGASLNVEQTGSGKLGLAVDAGLSRESTMQSAGGASSVVKVYKGETEGDVDITFTAGREWAEDGDDHNVETASVHVDEELNIAEKIKAIPDWIPQDYESAVKFGNEHGSSFVNDGIICFVRREEPDSLDEYPVTFEGSVAKKIASYELTNKVYDDPGKHNFSYSVRAYDIPNDSDLTVNFQYGWRESNKRTLNSYSFIKDSTGYITQTDKYSWLPDCHEEFNAYYEKHGAFSIQDGYVMYCTNVPSAGTNYLTIEQNGTGMLIEDHEERSEHYDAVTVFSNNADYTSQTHIIKLFKPVKSGTVKLAILKEIHRGKDVTYGTDAAFFTITEDMHIVPAELEDMNAISAGDCNGDGSCGISDLVTMKRWLLGKGSLPEYGSADLNGDGNVDIFDLVELRKLIISNIKEEPRPVMVFIRENYAWIAQQNVTVIDQYGSAYTFRYGEEDPTQSNDRSQLISMYGENWYDGLLKIMAEKDKTAGYIPDSAMTQVNKFAENAQRYNKAELDGIGYMCDAGSNSVYIIGTDDDGKPVNAKIATYGDMVGWIDDEDAKDFIKMLNSYDIFGNGIIELLEYGRDMF